MVEFRCTVFAENFAVLVSKCPVHATHASRNAKSFQVNRPPQQHAQTRPLLRFDLPGTTLR